MTMKLFVMSLLALILTTTAQATNEDVHAGNITSINRRQFVAVSNDLFRVPSLPADSRLDRYSTECLACHDGGIASATHFTAAADRRPMNSHPVGVPYPSRSQFAPIPSDSNIILIDGRVSCVTCHDMVADGYHLAIENDHSRLCFSCHLV